MDSMKFADEWTQHNEDWASIGFEPITYEAWLEEQVTHWRNCAGAKLEPTVSVYAEGRTERNLQATVNALYFENVRLRRMTEK
jgi:hypothetical protein